MFEPRVLLVHKIIFDLSLGGCKITSAPPVGFACECKYQVVRISAKVCLETKEAVLKSV